MLKLRKLVNFKYIAIAVVALLSISAVSPDLGSAATPADFGFYGEMDPEIAKALTGCSYRNGTGILSSVIPTFEKIFSTNVEKPTSIEDNFCFQECLFVDGKTPEECNEQFVENDIFPDTNAYKSDGSTAQGSTGLGGLIHVANLQIIEQRPASGVNFALDQVEKVIYADAVYAQAQPYFPGTGFQLLTPIQSFWGWAVTVSYSLMVLVVIFVAFAMLFRARLGGEQVVQIQNAIPSIILAMILIPLSYPISGLFIDAITLTTNTYHDFMFLGAGPGATSYNRGPEGDENLPDRTPYPWYEGRGLYADDRRLNIWEFRNNIGVTKIAEVFTNNCEEGDCYGSNNFLNNGIVQFIVSILDNFEGGVPMIIANVINLLFQLVAIVVSIRILIRLIKAFISLLVFPIISPFIMATVAIPGRGTKIVLDFIKQLAYAALVFIVTYIIFITVLVFTDPVFQAQVAGGGVTEYVPPILNSSLQRLGVESLASDAGGSIKLISIVFLFLGMGLFIGIPGFLDSLKKTLVPEGQIPIIGTMLQELGTSGTIARDWAVRKAPATAIGIGRRTASGLSVGTRFAGSFGGGKYGKSYGETATDARVKQAQDLRARQAQGGVGGLWAGARAQVVEGAARVTGAMYGKDVTGDLDKPMKFTLAFDLSSRIDVTRLQDKPDSIKRMIPEGVTSIARLRLVKADDSRDLNGTIAIKRKGTSFVIGEINEPGSSKAGIVLSVPGGTQVNEWVEVGTVASGKGTINIQLDTPAGFFVDGHDYTLQDEIEVRIGEAKASIKAGGISISPRS